ncbi:MAG: hypothetical protein NZL83_04825 [Candidatus Absconditabacterales bacterium]|nr:hypothetical protein [Candidatus Absconditabacterales bacterium]
MDEEEDEEAALVLPLLHLRSLKRYCQHLSKLKDKGIMTMVDGIRPRSTERRGFAWIVLQQSSK